MEQRKAIVGKSRHPRNKWLERRKMRGALILLVMALGLSAFAADALDIRKGFYDVPWGASIKEATDILNKKKYKVELSDAILGGKQIHVQMVADKLEADLFFYDNCFYKFQIMYSLDGRISEKEKEALLKKLKTSFEERFSDIDKSTIDYALFDSSTGVSFNHGPMTYSFTLRLYVANKKLKKICDEKEEAKLKKELEEQKRKAEEKLNKQTSEVIDGIMNIKN